MKELSPLLNIEKLSSEFNISESEMYILLMANFDELESFLLNVKYIKENQNLIDYNPLYEVEEKRKVLRPIELKAINLYSQIHQIHESIDKVSETYSHSVSGVNQKFAYLNKLFNKLEEGQKTK